ncbi:MAG: biosynthetic-type acetolactate synthase large subunit [Treponema sp.]|nr:biosynthetic-type acetolactate synthase large subunit [Spirochaetia bacterium]MDD7533688.1 biosynthetic-type acetolactate synthase large subunit [Treponema sp.]MDY5758415.1 biosynthetic-type acetolactate synthase large subunit [Treponema sp.]
MKHTGAQIIVKLLEMYGIETVAGIPGGSILPLYDELNRSSIRHVLVRHEQAAGFIAQGMARSTGKPAVCLATSGPGAMNLLTAIADARADSIPIIAITGQVNTSLIGTDAFQEADTFGLSFPITKHSIFIKTPYDLLDAIPKAFEISTSGRPGPVLIDVPRDVQLKECDFDAWPDIKKIRLHDIRFHTPIDEYSEKMGKITDLLAAAKRPVLYCGGGCDSEEAASGIKAFLQNYRLPVVTSLMGLGCVPESSDCFIGMVGMHGSHAANVAMHDSDLVIAAGVRFDDRATGLVSKFCPDAKIIHIDIDAAEVDKILESYISVVADVESVFPVIAQLVSEKKITGDENWLKKISKIKKECHSVECGRPKNEKLANPREIISKIPELAADAGLAPDGLIATTDVGQHQMWAAQYYPVERPRSFLTSGSLGTMGFGLPAALGAAIANPSKRIVCFSGDGSIMMNVQEMATLAELNLPVTIIVFQNGTLGMVYQQQKFLFDKNYSASVFGRSPDLLSIARGFGLEAIDADSDAEWYKKAFDNNRQNKPCFVRISVDSEENVLPFVPGGKANIDSIRD